LSQFYAPDGTAISLDEWAELFERRTEVTAPESWWRKHTELGGDVRVSTVWLGIDHNFAFVGPPLTWETMVFGGPHEDDCWRYATRAQAFDDHERIVRELRSEIEEGDAESHRTHRG
jgi:hypothetical protein